MKARIAPSLGIVAMALASVALRSSPADLSAQTLSTNATQSLEQAWRATGLDRLSGRVAHWSVTDVENESSFSARPAPPSSSIATARQIWFDPASGTERMDSKLVGLMAGDAQPVSRASVVRSMNVWAVLVDWRQSGAAKVVSRSTSREVLERPGAFGPERLYLDTRTHLPVRLEREEQGYRKRRVRAQYDYQGWTDDDEMARHPRAVARTVDGQLDVQRVEQAFDLVAGTATHTCPSTRSEPRA